MGRGDLAVQIASPPARNDIMAKEVRETYKIASSDPLLSWLVQNFRAPPQAAWLFHPARIEADGDFLFGGSSH